MENKIYTLKEMSSLHINTSKYHFNTTEIGKFDATLDMKAESRCTNIRSFYTLDDGRKFIATTHWFNQYLGIKEIRTGSKVHLTYSANTKGNVYLTAIQVMD